MGSYPSEHELWKLAKETMGLVFPPERKDLAFDLSREPAPELRQRSNMIFLLHTLIRALCFIDLSFQKKRGREEPFADSHEM